VARYEAGTGRPLTDLDFWMAFHAWRSASIVQGVYRRYLDGNMGERPPDYEQFARSVEIGAAAGLHAAGLA
jgi:aminoglycoside phosphotransferase (APT) family kinase protein